MTDLVNEKYFISLLRETLGLLLQDTLGHMWCAEALALYISVFILLLAKKQWQPRQSLL